MSTLAIEINDAGLRGLGSSGTLGEPSPGFALVERRRLVTGEPARAEARLKPRFVSHRHWERMDLEAVGRPFPGGLRNADLVHAHLADFWREIGAGGGASVLLTVPALYDAGQLGLLLGITRACEIPITGLVDTALAATHDRPHDRLHVDVQLGGASVVQIRGGERSRRGAVEWVEGAGLLAFQRLWADRLAQRFVRETRFDPLHRGESEQSLFDRLPSWVAQVVDGPTSTLELAGHSIEISADDLRAATEQPIGAIAGAVETLTAGQPTEVHLSQRAAALPGLAERLSADGEIHRLSADAPGRGALERREAIEAPGHELPLVLELATPSHHV